MQRTDQPVNTKTRQKHYLSHYPPYCFLPLTEEQAVKVNAALASRGQPASFLSPTQLDLSKGIAAALGKALAELNAPRP